MSKHGLLKPWEAEDILGVTTSDAYVLVERTDIPHIWIRGVLRFDHESLIRWLDEQRAIGRRWWEVVADTSARKEAGQLDGTNE